MLIFSRPTLVPTVGMKPTGKTCPNKRKRCRGKLVDTVLDWEHDLPESDLDMSVYHSTLADLNIGLGSSFQIMPSGKLPLKNAKFGGRFALINLQPIKLEKKADLVIHSYVDEVLEKVLKRLGIEELLEYDESNDPTKRCIDGDTWNIDLAALKEVEHLYRLRTSKKNKTKSKIEAPVKIKKVKKEDGNWKP